MASVNSKKSTVKDVIKEIVLKSEIISENVIQMKENEIFSLLDSSNDLLRLKGLRVIFKKISFGYDTSIYYAAVIKCVGTKNLELKKLVHIYLTHYATYNTDISLLAVGTLQRSLRDHNEETRRDALLVMAALASPTVNPIILASVQEMSTDVIVGIRKTACLCLGIYLSTDESHYDDAFSLVERFLNDKSVDVVVQAFNLIIQYYPNKLDLIHKKFRFICQNLHYMSEWDQYIAVKCLTVYSRKYFTNLAFQQSTELVNSKIDDAIVNHIDNEPSDKTVDKEISDKDLECSIGLKEESILKNLFISSATDESNNIPQNFQELDDQFLMDPDFRLLCNSVIKCLDSSNFALNICVINFMFYCGTKSMFSKTIKTIICYLSYSNSTKELMIQYIYSYIKAYTDLFQPYYQCFFLYRSDSRYINIQKLKILPLFLNEFNAEKILQELFIYITFNEKEIAVYAIKIIQKCVKSYPELTFTVIKELIGFLSDSRMDIVEEVVIAIRQLLHFSNSRIYSINNHLESTISHNDEEYIKSKNKSDSSVIEKIIAKLVHIMPIIRTSYARSSIIWLVYQYADLMISIAPDFLRTCIKGFLDEMINPKLQILNLATKLLILTPQKVKLMCDYLFDLAKHDPNYEVRDRTRFISFLFSSSENNDSTIRKYVREFIANIKIVSDGNDDDVIDNLNNNIDVDTVSFIIGSEFNGYQPLSEKPAQNLDPSIRDIIVEIDKMAIDSKYLGFENDDYIDQSLSSPTLHQHTSSDNENKQDESLSISDEYEDDYNFDDEMEISEFESEEFQDIESNEN